MTATQVGDFIFPPKIEDAFLVAVVVDQPRPQGSKVPMLSKTGKRYVRESSGEDLKTWREAVKAAILSPDCRRDWPNALNTENGPVRLTITFTLRRPKSHYRTGRNAHLLRDAMPPYPHGRPDLSKLLRSTEDAIVAAGVIADDAQIVDCDMRKVYPNTHYDALTVPGAVIRMWRL